MSQTGSTGPLTHPWETWVYAFKKTIFQSSKPKTEFDHLNYEELRLQSGLTFSPPKSLDCPARARRVEKPRAKEKPLKRKRVELLPNKARTVHQRSRGPSPATRGSVPVWVDAIANELKLQ